MGRYISTRLITLHKHALPIFHITSPYRADGAGLYGYARGTPTQHDDEQTAELLEEMYWIHVDSIGQSLDVPEINRELEFQEAQFFVTDFLFNFYDGGLSEIESYGIEPYSTWPYCINAISGAVHQAALNLAESPSEAAPHIMAIMEIIDRIHQEIAPAREGAGQPNKQKCDEFALGKTELMHRTSG